MSFDAEMLTCGDIKDLCRNRLSYKWSLKFTLNGARTDPTKRGGGGVKSPSPRENLLDIVDCEDFNRERALNDIANFHAY